jgi:glycosyltransferase involved in cell wall biosynthesis
MPPERSRVRVVHVTVGLGLGGAERLLTHLAPRIDRDRFEVSVLALKSWGPAGDALRAAGVPVEALNGRGFFDASLPWRFARGLAARRPDVVHAHLLWAGALSALFKPRTAKLVWHEHDTDEWMRAGHRLLESAVVGRADRVLAISQAVAGCFTRRHPWMRERVRVVLNAVPSARATPPTDAEKAAARREWDLPADAPLAGYVGRLELPKKGLDVLIGSFARLRRSLPSARLAVAGDGPDRARLERMARESGLADAVRFTGGLVDPRLFYDALDVFVLPSRWEGFGLSALEAMGSFLPVVASRVGGLPEVVADGETGLLAPPGDAASLESALRRLFAEPETARRFGAAGHARLLARFDPDVQARRVEEAYTEVLSR